MAINKFSAFDVINKMYNGKELEWNDLTDHDKQSGYFLVTRSMSMFNPLMAAELSRIKISPSGVMEHWQTILSKKFYKTPPQFYQVNPKKRKEQSIKKTKEFIPKAKTVDYYCDLNDLDSESYLELTLRYKDVLYEELKEIEKNIN